MDLKIDRTTTAADTMTHVLSIDREKVLHSWGPQSSYTPQIVVRAEGSYYWDSEGRRYLDFISQAFYANIGHSDKRVVEAIIRQANELVSVYSYGTVAKSRLAERLLSLFPSSYGRVYFGSNGSDAIELALKVARLVTGRQNVVAFWDGYHGASMGSTSISAEHRGRIGSGEPVPGTVLVPSPYHYRSPFRGIDQDDTDRRTFDFICQTVEQVGSETVAAIVGEPYVTAGPGVIPGRSYWKYIRELCDRHGILLVSDEMITGFGRSGKWFARDLYDYEPDIVCLGKGLSAGYAPISATVLQNSILERFHDLPLPYGLTYAGHALSCAAAVAVMDVMQEDGLVERAATTGRQLEEALHLLADRHPCIGDIRTVGLFANIELVRNRETKEPFPATASLADPEGGGSGIAVEVGKLLRERGIVIRTIPGIIKLGPPLNTSWSDVEWVIDELDEAFSLVDRWQR